MGRFADDRWLDGLGAAPLSISNWAMWLTAYGLQDLPRQEQIERLALWLEQNDPSDAFIRSLIRNDLEDLLSAASRAGRPEWRAVAGGRR